MENKTGTAVFPDIELKSEFINSEGKVYKFGEKKMFLLLFHMIKKINIKVLFSLYF